MTVVALNSEVTYDGDGIVLNFPITPDIKSEDEVVVYLIDESTIDISTPSGLDETLLSTPTHYAFDAPNPPTQVEMVTEPSATEKLRIERVTPKTQPDVYTAGSDANVAINNRVDQLTHLHQEEATYRLRIESDIDDLQGGVSAAGTATILDWATITTYAIDQVVISAGKLYRAVTAHTSNVLSTDILNGDIIEIILVGENGADGDQGPVGNTGPTGAAGATGAAGSNGTSGIITALASQAEAEAGVEATKGMTPLRTADAITAQVDKAQIVTNKNGVATNVAAISALNSRVTALEGLIQQATGKFSGQQELLNNSGPIELLGLDNGGARDKGQNLSRQESGTNFAEVIMYIWRKTSTEERFASWPLIMQYVGGTWLIGRERTNQLDETLDLDGITLTVATVGGIGLISYTSDLMSGADHDDESVITWLGQEISKL